MSRSLYLFLRLFPYHRIVWALPSGCAPCWFSALRHYTSHRLIHNWHTTRFLFFVASFYPSLIRSLLCVAYLMFVDGSANPRILSDVSGRL